MHVQHDGLLAHVRVIDLCDEIGLFCPQLLARLGAKVLRPRFSLEERKDAPTRDAAAAPLSGGNFSSLFPPRHGSPNPTDNRDTATRRRFIQLVSGIDVLVESFSPGYLDGIGLGFEALSRINPSLILASITGFGQSGPRKDDPSCDLIASAAGGQAYINGVAGLPPLAPFGMQAYRTGALFAATGILLALQGRSRDGKGRHIDISLQESTAATLDHVWVRYFNESVITRREAGRHWDHLFHILPCKDGFIHLTPLQQWDTLVDWLDSEGMAEDLKAARWQDESYRKAHVEHVIDVLARWTQTHRTGELFELGQLMGFPWAPVCDPAAVRQSRQLHARDFFKPVESMQSPGCGLGLPFRFRSGVHPSGKTAPASKVKARAAHFPEKISATGHDVLRGVRILDFTRVLAGPYVTRIMGDFGAQVIKVQSARTTTGVENNQGAFFATWNRNKLGVTLNMSRPEAKKLALGLVGISDVVIDNFSPRVMANWGLDYETIRRVRPDIVMAGMSAMGQTGPWKHFRGYASTIHSLSGHTYLNSHDKGNPTGLGFSYADIASGLYCAMAVLAALERRKRTGRGLYIDLSEYEAACALLGPALTGEAGGAGIPSCGAAPYGCYPCAGDDRWCAIAVLDEAQWRRLCTVMGDPSWVNDPRFATMEMRIRHRPPLDRRISAWTLSMRAGKIAAKLIQAGVPAAVVANAREVARDKHLSDRGFFMESAHPLLGTITTDRSPIRFVGEAGMPCRPSPSLGEHNSFVYKELLGLSDDEYETYVQKGVIG